MADIEITDEASLEAWLKTRPRRDAEIVAFRAAARVFPLWGRAMEEDALMSISALPVLRPLLNTFLRWFFVNQTLDRADREANSYLEALLERYWIATNSNSQNSRGIAADAAATAISANESWAYQVVSAALFAAEDAKTSLSVAIHADSSDVTYTSAWSVVEKDVHALLVGSFAYPLWPTPAPEWFTTADLETRAIWANDPPTWAFWEKWWDGVISGDMPFAPELLRDVALIENDIWEAGPKAVAAAIEKIEKIHDLRAQLDALTQAMEDEDLSQAQRGATLAHRGHNNPPEIIEAYEIVQASAVTIVQALDDAREELAKPAPEPSRLQAIGNWMLSAIMKAAGYCGGLADKFLQEFAGEMGKQAATVVAWLIKGGIGVSLLTAFAKSMISVWPM